MPTPPHHSSNTCGCKPWKRMYMSAEHERRKIICKWENDLKDFEQGMTEYEDTIRMLKQELMHTHAIQTAQRNVIEKLQSTLSKNGLPVKSTIASLTNCIAKNHEICPLSLEPINKSPFPMGDATIPCDLVINPLRPDHKCAQLPCGHRFNSIWLIYHFIESNTFRCPICRAGESSFCFLRNELPPAVRKLLEMVEEMKKNRAA